MKEFICNKIKIQHHTHLVSTNRTAMDLTQWEHLLTVTADTQSGGRGRMGRSFYSYKGGLYMTVLLDPDQITLPLSLVTPAAALATKAALEAAGVDGISVKWVNDLLHRGKKICGILTEAKTEAGTISRIAAGIGINLANTNFPGEIADKAGSLFYKGDRIVLAADIVTRLNGWLQKPQADIVAAYEKGLAFLGESVSVTDYAAGNRPVSGILLGVTAEGYLQLKLPDGRVKILSSAEIT